MLIIIKLLHFNYPEGNRIRTKLSLLLALVGLLIVGAAFVTNTPQRMMMVVLGLIIACGGCLVLLATDRFVNQHRSFITVVTGLFILLIIGYVIKVL